MKYEFVIEVNGKPSCEKCRFYEGSNGYDDSISCRLGGSGYCISDLLKKCKFKPKRELKAKQLEWEEYKNPLDEKDRVSRYKSEIYKIIHVKPFDEFIIQIFDNNVVGVYPTTIEEAKTWCQRHYNNLFNEMIGATNETY